MTTTLVECSNGADVKPLISRTSLLILAIVLIGMGLGTKIPPEGASTCLLFGSFGVASYIMLELVARYRFEQRYNVVRYRVEKVLARRLALLCERRSPSADHPNCQPK